MLQKGEFMVCELYFNNNKIKIINQSCCECTLCVLRVKLRFQCGQQQPLSFIFWCQGMFFSFF